MGYTGDHFFIRRARSREHMKRAGITNRIRRSDHIDFRAILTILCAMQKNSLVVIILCLLLASCGTSGHRVRVEPGPSWMRPWERPYWVDGVRYVPLFKADGFREEGLASWYGTEEHGNPTSNGELFDKNKPSAAHKTLPLGSIIRVTSKTSGKSLIVRVNDRGPFVQGRIVDLSYCAAQDLGIVSGGVVPVLLEVVEIAPTSVEPAKKGDAGSYYTLQVAAFSDRGTAHLLSQKLGKELAYSVIREVETAQGRFYRVHAGKFRTRSDAEAARASLARNGYPDALISTLH